MASPRPTPASPPGADHPPAAPAWWRERFMWLVLGGPALVVVAGLATVVIATRGADVLVPSRSALQDPRATPAVQGRNHAATPAAPSASR